MKQERDMLKPEAVSRLMLTAERSFCGWRGAEPKYAAFHSLADLMPQLGAKDT